MNNISTNSALAAGRTRSQQESDRVSQQFIADVLECVGCITFGAVIRIGVGAAIAFVVLCLCLGIGR